MRPSVSVLVHLAAGPDEALAVLGALADLPEAPEHEVVLVDDTAGALDDLLARAEGDVAVARTSGSAGFAAAMARGAERAGGGVVVLVRDGAVPVGDWLAPLVAALDAPDVRAATSVTEGTPATHVAEARALALRADDLTAAGGVPDVADTVALAALALSIGGDVHPVLASRLAPPPPVRARGWVGEEVELTVVVPTLDAGSERVRRCVAALQARTGVAHELVVVDNGSPPQGYAAPVNAGLRAARGRYAAVVNDDVEVLPGWWPPLRAALDGGAAVAFPATEGEDAERHFDAWCWAVTRAALADHAAAPGEFLDPELRVWFQDLDLVVRLAAAGAAPVRVHEARVRHARSTTVTSADPALRGWMDEQAARDHAAFARKHPGVELSLHAAP